MLTTSAVANRLLLYGSVTTKLLPFGSVPTKILRHFRVPLSDSVYVETKKLEGKVIKGRDFYRKKWGVGLDDFV